MALPNPRGFEVELQGLPFLGADPNPYRLEIEIQGLPIAMISAGPTPRELAIEIHGNPAPFPTGLFKIQGLELEFQGNPVASVTGSASPLRLVMEYKGAPTLGGEGAPPKLLSLEVEFSGDVVAGGLSIPGLRGLEVEFGGSSIVAGGSPPQIMRLNLEFKGEVVFSNIKPRPRLFKVELQGGSVAIRPILRRMEAEYQGHPGNLGSFLVDAVGNITTSALSKAAYADVPLTSVLTAKNIKNKPRVVADAYFSNPANWHVTYTVYMHASGGLIPVRHVGGPEVFVGTLLFSAAQPTGVWRKAVLLVGKNDTLKSLFDVSAVEIGEDLTVTA